MKSLLTVAIFFLTSFSAQARDNYNVQSIDASSCQAAGHPEEYVLRVCPIRFNNGDRVVLSGNNLRSNLVVQNAERGLDPYYMALGLVNADYSVGGNIDLVTRNGRRHALIYRLNYTTYDGQTGYQIITIRLGNGLNRASTTCTRYGFDSNNSGLFTHLSGAQQEAAMRAKALEQMQDANFQSGRQRCMLFEHSHNEVTPTDVNEGDNAETAHP